MPTEQNIVENIEAQPQPEGEQLALQEHQPEVVNNEAPAKDDKHVPVGALLAERKKRQEEQRRVQELQHRLEALERRTQPQSQEASLTADEIFENLPGAFEKLEKTFSSKLQAQKMELSEAFARERYEDYDEVLAEYAKMAGANPSLAQKIAYAQDPAGVMYRETKSMIENRNASNPDFLEKKIMAEVEKRLKAMMPESQQEAPKQQPIFVSTARGSGAPAPDSWSGPTPLGDILRRR